MSGARLVHVVNAALPLQSGVKYSAGLRFGILIMSAVKEGPTDYSSSYVPHAQSFSHPGAQGGMPRPGCCARLWKLRRMRLHLQRGPSACYVAA